LTVLPLPQRLRSRRRSPRLLPLPRDPRLLSLMSPRRRRTRLLSRYVSHSSFFPTHHPSFLLIHLFFLLNPAFFLVRFSHRPRHSKPTPADPQDKVEKGKGFFAKFFGSKEKSPKKQKVKTPKVSCQVLSTGRELMIGREV